MFELDLKFFLYKLLKVYIKTKKLTRLTNMLKSDIKIIKLDLIVQARIYNNQIEFEFFLVKLDLLDCSNFDNDQIEFKYLQ